MGKLLALIRLILFAICVLVYIATVLIISLFVGDKTKASEGLRTPVIRMFFKVLGIRVKHSGAIPDETVLFVGNHISYLDPFVIVYHTIAWPVAKNEVASWPLIGYAVSLSGVLFVKRQNASSLRATRDAISSNLLKGNSVIVYPEGTTSDGTDLLPFRHGVYDTACKNNIPVVPVTIHFPNPDAAYIRKDAFLPHFMKLFSHWRVDVFIHFHEKIINSNGRASMELSQKVIGKQLQLFHISSSH